MLPGLRRRGIVESWREHSPGSIIVKLAPLSTLLGAARRRRDHVTPTPRFPETLAGLRPETLRLLKQLAMQNLDTLGIVATDEFLGEETRRIFSTLMTTVIDSADRESALHAAVVNALEEQ